MKKLITLIMILSLCTLAVSAAIIIGDYQDGRARFQEYHTIDVGGATMYVIDQDETWTYADIIYEIEAKKHERDQLVIRHTAVESRLVILRWLRDHHPMPTPPPTATPATP